jgi:hypothetical protein
VNKEEYIASGILESYLSGACSEQERKEVECLSKIYPEIKLELDQLEKALENYAMANAKGVPEDAWDTILSEIAAEEPKEPSPLSVVAESDITSESNTFNKVFRIAAVILLLLSTTFAINFYKQSRSLEAQIEDKKDAIVGLEEKINKTTADLEAQNNLLATLALPETQRLVLKGVENKYPESQAYIVYNAEKKQVYIHPGSLPSNPQGMQYQLWGLKDGVPISLGVFDYSTNADFLVMEQVSGVQAFAVTLEEAGGKPTPNLEELYVIGELG